MRSNSMQQRKDEDTKRGKSEIMETLTVGESISKEMLTAGEQL